MNDVIKIKKPNQVSNVKVSHEASSFYADLSKQWAIKLDKPIENGEYSSKYYAKISEQNADSANKSAMSAEVAASNLEKFVINSLYFPELKISNEDSILNNLEHEKRSTFDKSKFTVVGNPTITDDGIASGFSGSNYITIPNYLKGKRNYEIDIEFTLPGTLKEYGYVFSEANAMTGLSVFYDRTYVYVRATSANVNGFTKSIANGNYKLKIKYNDGVGSVQYRVNNAEEETYQLNLSNYVDFQEDLLSLSCRIKNGTGDGSLFNGSIDLKAFSITVDGKEVFNGNKTGVDTIKADKYEVVGSPTITDDGVASGFSRENLIKMYCPVENGKHLKIKTTFKYLKKEGTILQPLFWLYSNADINSRIMYLSIKLNGDLSTALRDKGYISGSIERFIDGKTYTLEYETDMVTYFKIYIDGVLVISQQTGLNIANITNKLNYIVLPAGLDANNPTIIEYDLNAFKVYVDDQLVYQPCLKIPYTQSKTGSKIVDGVYRDRVQDMYEQYGYTHYCTLGDTDFTLATCKGSDVVESGDNYEQTADLTLKQWGSATIGQTVNLLPYKDTNYAATLANGSKTKSSFVANATGDFIAIGKTVLG